jgi:hypothetical protein
LTAAPRLGQPWGMAKKAKKRPTKAEQDVRFLEVVLADKKLMAMVKKIAKLADWDQDRTFNAFSALTDTSKREEQTESERTIRLLRNRYRFMAAYDHLLAKMTTKNKPPGGDLNPSAPTPGKWGQQGGLSPQWPEEGR